MEILKHMKKIICLAVTVCIGIFGAVTVGCNDDEEEQYTYEPPKNCDVVFERTESYWAEEYKNFIAICNTFDELEEAYLRNGYGSFDNDKVREYMDEHSEEKSLVVCAFHCSSYFGQYRIKEVEVNVGKLTLYIKSPVSDINMAFDVSTSAYLMAGVDKTIIANVTELTYEIC